MRQKLHNFSLLVTKRRRSQVNPPNRSDSRSATHPSDHNSVHVCQITNKGLEREQCMAMKRRQRDEQTAIQKARVEEMENILREARVKERVMERGLDEGAYGRRTEHRRASLLAPTSGHLSYEAMCSGVYNPIWVAVSDFGSHNLCSRFLITFFNRRLLVAYAVAEVGTVVEAVVEVVEVVDVADRELTSRTDSDDCKCLKSQRRQAVGTQLRYYLYYL